MRIGHILLVFLATLVATPGAAQTLDQALADAYGADDAGLRLLREGGAALGEVLTLERVPSGSYVVEVAIRLKGSVLRYPLKLERTTGSWKLEWQPDGVFAAALLGMAKSGALPTAATRASWSSAARLPSLPIIGTRKRFVTPFGEVPVEDRGDRPPKGDLEISPGLVQAAHSWVHRVLDDDPGPAGVDLILDGKLSWRLANKILFNASVVGLYQVSIVTGAATLGAVRVASPVTASASSNRPRVVAVYKLDNGYGLRMSQGDQLIPGDGCAAEMSACVADDAAFAARVADFVVGGEPTMFAAGRELAVEDAVRLMVRLETVADLAPHRMVIGYVQK